MLLFQMNGGIKQANGEETEGLTFNPGFFWALAKAMLTGDALNVLGYRIRPYEVKRGSHDWRVWWEEHKPGAEGSAPPPRPIRLRSLRCDTDNTQCGCACC